jgi:hypothetical protein
MINYINNPLINHSMQSLEMQECKENLIFNKLLKRNLKSFQSQCKKGFILYQSGCMIHFASKKKGYRF